MYVGSSMLPSMIEKGRDIQCDKSDFHLATPVGPLDKSQVVCGAWSV